MKGCIAMEVNVVFQPEGKRVRIKSGSTILEAANLAGADLTSICGGKGKCGKCKVIVEKEKGNVSSIAEAENRFLSSAEISAGYRLACCTSVMGNVVVRIPEESRTGRQRLQVEGIETPVKLEPLVKKYFVKLQGPTLKDPRSDVDRLLDELLVQYGLENLELTYDLVQRLPFILRDSGWEVTVVMRDNEIISLEPGDTTDRIFGYAVDIGTTKLAGYLLDLITGKVIAAGSAMNPQIPYGEDVVTRITYAMKGIKELKELQRAVVGGLNQILADLLEKTGVKREEVYEMTAVGNTAMHHLFLKLNPKFLALSPYTPVLRKEISVNAKRVGVKINSRSYVHVLPVIAGFVGADNVAVILATEIYKRSELCLALDVGTNTEIVLGNKDEMLVCSCASGPAFEGAHIKHGMRAATGAIEKVRIDPETLEVKYWTIDDAKPRGICGSALVDVLAEMLKAGVIDATGTMNKELNSPRLRVCEGVPEFVLAWKKETSIGDDIVVTQRDVRELQLAKAAMNTGAMTLMRKKGVTEKDIDIVFIAGAFGSYIDPESSTVIGMHPEFPLEKVKVVGNAAGTGARMALVSKTCRKTAEEIHGKIRYVELAAEPCFQAEFMNSTFMPYADLNRFPRTSELLRKLGRYPKKPIPTLPCK
jgi:uncharacterized 2Fe-2S/4Fe-4S cluster protein (DUF4445 family)